MSITPEANAKTLTQLVATEIKVQMARADVRQSQLAREIGKTEQWLSVRLRGRQPLDVNDLALIAQGLGVGIHDLLPPAEVAAKAAKAASRESRAPAIAHYCGTAERTSDRTPRVTRAPGHPPIVRAGTGGAGRTSHVLRVPACAKRSSGD